MRDNAAQLQDGTKVFQSNDGSIYTEHGKRLSDEKARNIRFSDNAPSWETYKAEKSVLISFEILTILKKNSILFYQYNHLTHCFLLSEEFTD